MPEKLKPCPACGNTPVAITDDGDPYVYCKGSICGVQGPWNDPDGAKWNAIPRRTDASQGMSDGELIARAIVNGLASITVMMGALKGHDMAKDLGDGPKMFATEIANELDRRAAARKESKP